MKRNNKPWQNLIKLAKFKTGEQLASFLIRSYKKTAQKWPISTEWSVEGKIAFLINGISYGPGLSADELAGIAKIIRVLRNDWHVFWFSIGEAIDPWLREKAEWFEANAKIAKEVEAAFKNAQDSLAKAKRKMPKGN